MGAAERHKVADTVDPFEFCYEQGWTDGLPVIPPTEDRAAAMLSGTKLAPSTVIAKIPPAWADATAEKIAVKPAAE